MAFLHAKSPLMRQSSSVLIVLLVLGCAGARDAARSGSNGAAAARSNVPPNQVSSLEELGLAPNYEFDEALPDCPMQVPDTQLSSLPIDGGVAFVFTTRSSPEEVRHRARKFAREYDENRGADLPPTRTQVRDIPDGARAEVRAVWENDIALVTEHLRWRAERMRSTGSCPLLRQATR